MRIALVVPPGYSVPHAQSCLERLGFGYLITPLREAGHTVRILDGVLEGLGWSDLEEALRTWRPEVVGLSLMSHHLYEDVVAFVCRLRGGMPSTHICVGGVFPSLNARKLLANQPEVDTIAAGEGERTLVELADRLATGRSLDVVPGLVWRDSEGEIRDNPPYSPVDLDELPRPARDQLPLVLSRSGPAALITSRGCYSRCTFCAIEAVTRSQYSRVVRSRSPTCVVDEIEDLMRRFGARKLYFVDENFIGGGRRGRERARQLAREIRHRGLDVCFSVECRCMDVEEETFQALVDAGLQRVFLGVESIDQDELDRFRKAQDRPMVDRAIEILRRLGVHVEIGYILFTPWSTLDSLRAKRKFLEAFGPHATASLGSYLSVMPGTALEHQLRQEGLLVGRWPSYWFEFLDRQASILFCLVQRELTDPWAEVMERVLAYYWSQPDDWSLAHAQRRTGDSSLGFVQRLIEWIANQRLACFDALLEMVADLDLPDDADEPPAVVLETLRRISRESRRAAADAQALLSALEDPRRQPSSRLERLPVPAPETVAGQVAGALQNI